MSVRFLKAPVKTNMRRRRVRDLRDLFDLSSPRVTSASISVAYIVQFYDLGRMLPSRFTFCGFGL